MGCVSRTITLKTEKTEAKFVPRLDAVGEINYIVENLVSLRHVRRREPIDALFSSDVNLNVGVKGGLE